jgi:pyruvate,water dikinase
VILSLEEAARLGPGDVLVTTFTDPGWTPLFPGLGAVVTETGGLLSHAAVIAREYGIPAVLSVPGATRRIPDGAWVVVDGGAGTVVLDPVAGDGAPTAASDGGSGEPG